MTRQVLITRPADDAEELAAEIRAKGFVPVIAPMLEIVPLAVSLPNLSLYKAIAFTSARGVRVFAGLTAERGNKVYCVGPQTAASAREGGWRDVVSADGAAADLAALLAKAQGPVLHVGGADEARALPCEKLVVYKAEKVKQISAEGLRALEDGMLATALFFSARTAENFTELLQAAGRTEQIRETKALCLADSVVKSLRALPWRDVRVAGRSDRAAMMKLLDDEISG